MASHAIFQYNVLAIDDTHNTWTNMIVKMIILRLLGSSDDKEKIGVARPEGPPLRVFRRCIRRLVFVITGSTGECFFPVTSRYCSNGYLINCTDALEKHRRFNRGM